MITIQVKELELLEILLPGRSIKHISWSKSAEYLDYNGYRGYAGYQEVNHQLRPLPPGSTFYPDKGVFYWQLGAGFLGEYQLVFFKEDKNGWISKHLIKITIMSKTDNTP
jgi:hypothetical protein